MTGRRHSHLHVDKPDTDEGTRMDEGQLEQIQSLYKELIGFMPERAAARHELLSELEPKTLMLQEEMRRRLMYPPEFDVKTSQLMLFGMLLMTLSDAARLHAIGARRNGATWEELNAVVGLAFLFRGMPAANLGALYMKEIQEMENTETTGADPGG